MIKIISMLALLLAIYGAFIFIFLSWLPRLGVHWLSNSSLKRLAINGTALLISVVCYLKEPGTLTLVILALVLFLFAFIFIVVPANIFPALQRTVHAKKEKTFLNPQTEVLGVTVNGESLALPMLDLLVPHHLVNDVIGGKSVVISYCPACRSGMVYSSEVQGQKLTFEVAGMWRKNLVMTDLETRTLWQQVTGEAVYGKLKGKHLEKLFVQQMTMDAWAHEYPETSVAEEPRDAKQAIYPKKQFIGFMLKGTQRISLPGINKRDKRLPAHEEVVGVHIGKAIKAYPVSLLREKKTISDTIDGIAVELRYDPGSKAITIFKGPDREPLAVERHWWLAWSEFYPETMVYVY